jgi:hypothetical protein
VDPLNPFIGEYPAHLVNDVYNGPIGQRLIMTMRVGNATVTAMLAKDDAIKWRDQITEYIGKMNGLILPPSGG